MKKLFKLLGVLALASIFVIGCTDPGKTPEPNPDPAQGGTLPDGMSAYMGDMGILVLTDNGAKFTLYDIPDDEPTEEDLNDVNAYLDTLDKLMSGTIADNVITVGEVFEEAEEGEADEEGPKVGDRFVMAKTDDKITVTLDPDDPDNSTVEFVKWDPTSKAPEENEPEGEEESEEEAEFESKEFEITLKEAASWMGVEVVGSVQIDLKDLGLSDTMTFAEGETYTASGTLKVSDNASGKVRKFDFQETKGWTGSAYMLDKKPAYEGSEIPFDGLMYARTEGSYTQTPNWYIKAGAAGDHTKLQFSIGLDGLSADDVVKFTIKNFKLKKVNE